MNRSARLCTAVLALLLGSGANAELSVEASASSQVVDRGIAITDHDPVIGATATWNSTSGFFAGIGGYYGSESPSPTSLTKNLQGYVGWFLQTSDDSAVEISVAHAQFPDVSEWNYIETRVDYHWSREAAVTLAYSPDYYGRDASRALLAATWRPALGDDAYLHIAGGVGRMGGYYDNAMYYAEAGIGRTFGRFDVMLTASTLDDDTAFVLFRSETAIALRIGYLLR